MATHATSRFLSQSATLNVSHLADVIGVLRRCSFATTNWFRLGLELGLLKTTVDSIESDYYRDVSRCLMECLVMWLRSADNVVSRGGPPTWDSLSAALRAIGEMAVADQIDEEKRPAIAILDTHYHSLSQLSDPVNVARLLYEENVITGVVLDDMESTGQSLTETSRILLAAVKEAIQINYQSLQTFGTVLCKTDNVPVGEAILSDYEKAFPYSSYEIVANDREMFSVPAQSAATVAPHNQAPPIEVHISDQEMFDVPVLSAVAPNDQSPLVQGDIDRWLQEGIVEVTITRINMHGPPGAGKTCAQRLLLNEPPPDEAITDSTPIACPAVKATRVSCTTADDEDMKWKKVDRDALLERLASDLKVASASRPRALVESTAKPSNVMPIHTTIPVDSSLPMDESLNVVSGSDHQMMEISDTAPIHTSAIDSSLPRELLDSMDDSLNVVSSNDRVTDICDITPVHTSAIDSSGEDSMDDSTGDSMNDSLNVISGNDHVKVIDEIRDLIPVANTQLSDHWVYIVDSGGQPAYQELLPLFVRTASVNILTIDLSKGLENVLEYQYRTENKIYSISNSLSHTNESFVESVVHSRAVYQPVESQVVQNNSPTHPVYLVLGTRYDDENVTDDVLKKMNERLMSSESLKPYLNNCIIPYQPGKSVIFPVNTLFPDKSKERTEASRKLCRQISNRPDASRKIIVPIRWFVFELYLLKLAEEKSRCFLTETEAVSAGARIHMTENDISAALTYLHNVTIIFHYPDISPSLIFVDPQPILEILSQIIALTYIGDPSLITDPMPSVRDHEKLRHLGLFKEELLPTLKGSVVFSGEFQPSYLIKLLKHLHIIAEVKRSYFLPCALPSCEQDLSTLKADLKLLVIWRKEDELFGSEHLPVPQGMFPLTVVHLLNQKNIFISQDERGYKFRDAMSLRLKCMNGKKVTLHIINRKQHMEFHLTGASAQDQCSHVHQLITAAIESSSDRMHIEHNHKYTLLCRRVPPQPNCYCVLDNKTMMASCTKCDDTECVNVSGNYPHSIWFNDKDAPTAKMETSQEVTQDVTLKITQLHEVLSSLKAGHFSNENWRKLGLTLGLYEDKLDTIAANNKGDVEGCLRKCLTRWLKKADGVKDKGGPTMTALADALEEIGETSVADDIGEDFSHRISHVRKHKRNNSDDDEPTRPSKRNAGVNQSGRATWTAQVDALKQIDEEIATAEHNNGEDSLHHISRVRKHKEDSSDDDELTRPTKRNRQ